jgi:hypothetical protein
MWHAQERSEMKTGFRWENLTGRGHLENLDADGKIILAWFVRRCWRMSTGYI